ncbi:two-component response regulator-like APRR9 isoform X3 [Dioscorea cayenensis subsp. rotundata]|uniref:Two-component response regulator-like APRR9 isoform X3 n=1 Tax=Dioscorea cayennensis subsp. rotundata TaxID=55577 RepID=A0AB40AR61_DIOCR|nr:two-component response regulator-like APRR9 isoform X3 [Dioscorea cayenensis subsp. rotundata]
MADEPLSTVHRSSDGGASSTCPRRVRWDRFLPRPSIRVLLVEHDDSTRHIVAALLRKCGYHVAAVGDGLKAWEFMTEKRFQFDLVLAEVSIPSLSGIALLSRIMSSENCKNIPVIMMSSHDSVNVVLKCMLKGAVDFLVKPVRKNELKNLWQHVWRKHSLSQQVNASENNAASNRISVNAGEGSETGENSGEGKYDQNAGTKLDMEIERVQELTDPHLVEGGNSNSDEDAKLGAPNHDFADTFVIEGTLPVQGCHSVDKDQMAEYSYKILPSNEEASSPRRCIEEVNVDLGSYCQNMHVNGIRRVSAESSQEKIEHNVGSPPLWELSLRRREFRDRHKLNHSDSSAFSRYGDKKIQPSIPKLSSSALDIGNNECADQCLTFPQLTDNGTDHSDKDTSLFLNGKLPHPQVNVGEVPMNYDLSTNCYKDTSALPSSDSHRENALIGCSASGEDSSSHHHQAGFMPSQIPVGATHYQTFCPGYGAILQPVFYCENSLSPHTSNTVDIVRYPISSHQSGLRDNHADNDHPAMKFSHPGECHQPYHSLNPSDVELENRALSCPQEQANRNEIFSLDILNRSRSNGSAETTDGVMPIGNALENGNESSFQNCNKEALECSHSRRAAALIKFRMKRKDRCFQKKVRYYSRKKLAEQRPRVKGQFVKQKNVGSSTATDAEE